MAPVPSDGDALCQTADHDAYGEDDDHDDANLQLA